MHTVSMQAVGMVWIAGSIFDLFFMYSFIPCSPVGSSLQGSESLLLTLPVARVRVVT